MLVLGDYLGGLVVAVGIVYFLVWLVSCACGLFGLFSAAATFMTLAGL